MIALLALGCAPDGSRELTVFAASSLTTAFGELEQAFEAGHPDVDVRLSFAGSQTLRAQIEAGAPAHVFASADRAHADALASAGRIAEPTSFASNALVLAVPPGRSPLPGIEALAEVDRLVLAASEVPAGAYADALLARAAEDLGPQWSSRVASRVVSRELSVRAAASRLVLGEADAALIYATDAHALGLPTVPLPDALIVRTSVWSAPVLPASDDALAWEAFVRGPGAGRLRAHGFEVP